MRRELFAVLALFAGLGGAFAQVIGGGVYGDSGAAGPPAVPQKSIVIIGAGQVAGLSTSVTSYMAPTSGFNSATNSTSEAGMPMVMPLGGSFSHLTWARNGATTGGTYQPQFRVSNSGGSQTMKNGNETCTEGAISGALAQCSDGSNSDALNAGDFWDLSIIPASTPAGTTGGAATALFTSNNTNEIPIFGGTWANAVLNDYVSFGTSAAQNAAETQASVVFNQGGVFDNFICAVGTAPGAVSSGKSITCTVFHETAGNCGTPNSTLLASTIFENATVGPQDTNPTHAQTMAAGDCLSVQITGANTPTLSRLVFAGRWKPTTTGEAIYFSINAGQNAGSGVTRFYTFAGQQTAGGQSATNANLPMLPAAGYTSLTVRDPALLMDTSPGGATSRVYHQRHGTTQAGMANYSSDLSCSQGTAATTCTGNGATPTASPSDFVDWSAVNTSTPAAGTYSKMTIGGIVN